jgi:hypothetical protein
MDFLNIKDIDSRFVFEVSVHYNKFSLKKVEYKERIAAS